MRIQPLSFVAIIVLCFGASAQGLPTWTVGPLALVGLWETSSDVVVADAKNIRALGGQTVLNPPAPASLKNRRIYWCQADLEIKDVIKGDIKPGTKKFVWGAIRSGCNLAALGRATIRGDSVVRVWFIREEASLLRPVVDGGGIFFLAINGRFEGTEKNRQEHFGELLLTPDAVAATSREYAAQFLSLADAACLVLGKEQCVERIKQLARVPDGILHGAVCKVLHDNLETLCPPAK